jgi:aspartyl protease family protein
MSDGENFSLIYSVLLLVLVGSAFISYQLPLKKTVKMVLVWILIFAFGFALVYGIENIFITDETDAQSGEGDGGDNEPQGGSYV